MQLLMNRGLLIEDLYLFIVLLSPRFNAPGHIYQME